ncbi:hypothetical protein DITRI_Ditri13aG0040900 [Diplodiscus trichospermus]
MEASISKKIVSSTYLGSKGANMMVWTFLVIFVAVLGSLYLHLGNSLNENAFQIMAKNVGWRHERRPCLVTRALFTQQVTYHRFQSGCKRWSQRVVSEVIRCSVGHRVCREHMYGFSVLFGGSWLIVAAIVGSNFGELYQCCGRQPFLKSGVKRLRFSFYTHCLYIIFALFFILHVGIGYFFIMLPGFYLFMIDRFLRFLQSRSSVRLLSARVLPCHTLELNFAKSPGLSYNPTSIIFVNVPSISKLQWHPFTISSNSRLESDILSVIIRSEGSWSTKLYQMLSSPSSVDRLDVFIEGPYGPPSNHFLRHDTLVMVSGGSGITPFISIIRELMFWSKTSECKTPDVILIAAFKSSADLTMLDLLLPMTSSQSELSNLQLQIRAYVTRENEPAINNSTRSIWFRPHPTDTPMAAILGPSSWLWLTVLTLLAICVSIAATASAAVFWNKRQYAKEAKQIENMEGQTSEGSPFLRPYNVDRELESLPQQSIAEATKIHYGERPDLKRILLECKGSSIGVSVCGPTKMRRCCSNLFI